MKFLSLVWSNLQHKKLRTALTVLSILVAFLLYGFLCAIEQAFDGGVSLAGADRLVVRHKVSIIQSLPVSYEQRIANVPGVESVVHQSWFGGIYQDPKNFFASMPVEQDKFLQMFPEYVLPEAQKKAWLETRNGAIVGQATIDRFKWKIGDHVPLSAPIWGPPANRPIWDFEIVGVYTGAKKTTDTTNFFFRYDYFDESKQRNKGEVGWFTVRVRDSARAAEIASKIDDEFANSSYETKAEPEGAFAASFAKQVGDIGAIMTAVLSAVFFTILLIAGNTMAQAVRERTEEIGVLKALGFTNELVLALVLLESCVIVTIGGCAGLGIGWLIISSGNPAPTLFRTFYLPPRDLLTGLALVAALGIVAGALPAIQAMRMHIAEALRRIA